MPGSQSDNCCYSCCLSESKCNHNALMQDINPHERSEFSRQILDVRVSKTSSNSEIVDANRSGCPCTTSTNATARRICECLGDVFCSCLRTLEFVQMQPNFSSASQREFGFLMWQRQMHTRAACQCLPCPKNELFAGQAIRMSQQTQTCQNQNINKHRPQ